MRGDDGERRVEEGRGGVSECAAGTPALVLRVADALPEDVGEHVIRMPPSVLDRLGLDEGEAVELTGRRKTVARAAVLSGHSGDSELARIESVVRRNAGAGLDEQVIVRRVELGCARNVVLIPGDGDVPNVDADVRSLSSLLAHIAVIAGDEVRVAWPGSRQRFFTVDGTAPRGAVAIDEETKIVFAEGEEAAYDRGAAYEDIGGLDEEVRRIREMVEFPIRFPQVFDHLGVEAPKGVLIYGPPGTGKTLIARAAAGESGASFFHIDGPEIIHKLYGESEAQLREIFSEAQHRAPSIIFIDELDAIAPRRTDVFGDVEKRIVAQLLVLMDGLRDRGQVVVIGATNVPLLVDPALRRPGRFDRELSLSPPSREGRAAILAIHVRPMRVDPSVDVQRLAEITHGFVGADLAVLCKEAGMCAVRRLLEGAPSGAGPYGADLSRLAVTMSDFESAFREVEPTALRELLADKPTVTWDDVGGLAEVRQELQVLARLLASATASPPEGLLPRGILLTGAPGVGKTLVANALAGSAGMPLMVVEPATLAIRSGETERRVRDMFKRALQIAPCIVFFDELDSLAPSRSGSSERQGDSIVSQLCIELDHLTRHAGILVMAATSRPGAVDRSLLRPGRFDLVLDLPLPTPSERRDILRVHTRGLTLAADVDLNRLASQTEGLAGADLAGLCRAAYRHGLRRLSEPREETLESCLALSADDFGRALHDHLLGRYAKNPSLDAGPATHGERVNVTRGNRRRYDPTRTA